MRPLRAATAFVLCSLALCVAEPIIREPGAIYLSDFDLKPLQLRLLQPAPCYFDIGLTRYAGTLRYPQLIDIEAVTDNAFRIHGNAQQGGVAAWLSPKYLEATAPNFLSDLKKAEARRQTVEALIAKNQLAIGMTTSEVLRSVGKPQKKSSFASQSGTQETWEYIKYALIPQTSYVPGYYQNAVVTVTGEVAVQQFSGLYPTTIYVKIPIGKLSVAFKDGIVQSLEQTEGNTANSGEVNVVVPPVMVY